MSLENPNPNSGEQTESKETKPQVQENKIVGEIPAEEIPNTVYKALLPDIKKHLNTQTFNVSGSEVDILLDIKTVPSIKPIQFTIDADKANVASSVQNELNERIAALNLKGGHDITSLQMTMRTYENDDTGKRIKFGGGYTNNYLGFI